MYTNRSFSVKGYLVSSMLSIFYLGQVMNFKELINGQGRSFIKDVVKLCTFSLNALNSEAISWEFCYEFQREKNSNFLKGQMEFKNQKKVPETVRPIKSLHTNFFTISANLYTT